MREALLLAVLVIPVAPSSAQDWFRTGGPVADQLFPEVVTDRLRSRLVAVAGDTWEWDGAAWRWKGSGGGNIVYDPVRGRTLMLGAPFMRQWDGHAWQKIASDFTPTSVGPAVFDVSRGVVVMVDASQTVMEWNGNAWRQVGTGAPAQYDWRLVYDSTRAQVLMLTRAGPTQPLQTYSWNGTLWTQLFLGGPAGDMYACADDPVRGRVVAHGGTNSRGDTWEWDGTTWTLMQANGPLRRFGHAMGFDPVRGQVLSFGGVELYQHAVLDAWAWTGTTWQQVATPTEPPGRSHAAMAYDDGRQRLVLYGGAPEANVVDEVWEWDGLRWSKATPPSGGPGPRMDAAMAYDSWRGTLLMFGGSAGNTVLGDLWQWNGTAWTLLASGGPPPRSMAAMAFDTARGRLVLFGGGNSTGNLNDTWEWDGSSWRQGLSGPMSAGRPGMVYDPITGVTLVVPIRWPTQTWSWNGIAWQLLGTGTGASPGRGPTALAFDATAGAALAVSPAQPTQDRLDSWLWNGAAWVSVNSTITPTVGRFDHDVIAATDLGHGRALVDTGTFLWQHGGVRATADDWSGSCPGGGVDPYLASFGTPRVGDAGYSLDLRAGPGRVALAGIALATTSVSLGSGCLWRLGQSLVTTTPTDVRGLGTVALPVPAVAALRGVTVYTQAAALEPFAPRGFVLTQALALRLGD